MEGLALPSAAHLECSVYPEGDVREDVAAEEQAEEVVAKEVEIGGVW